MDFVKEADFRLNKSIRTSRAHRESAMLPGEKLRKKLSEINRKVKN